MKIQHLDVEMTSKQDNYKIRALKPKKTPEERRKQGHSPRDDNFHHQAIMTKRKLVWNIPYPMRKII